MEQGTCILCGQTCDVGKMDKLCNRCWELKTRIIYNPNLAIIVLDELGYDVKMRGVK
jgi:hypothetical protein